MPKKHAALFGTTALLFVLGLGVGFNGTEVGDDQVARVKCGSLLTADTTAAAFKYEVAHPGDEHLAEAYAARCEAVRAARQVPTYSALGLGVIGLFASSLILGRRNAMFASPL